MCKMISPLIGLSEKKIDYIFKFFITKFYRKGEPLYQEGEPATAFFLVFEGRAEISKMNNQGIKKPLILSDKGDFLGIESLNSLEYEFSAEIKSSFAVLMIFKKKMLGEFKEIIYSFLTEMNAKKKAILNKLMEKKEVAEKTIKQKLIQKDIDKIRQELKEKEIVKETPCLDIIKTSTYKKKKLKSFLKVNEPTRNSKFLNYQNTRTTKFYKENPSSIKLSSYFLTQETKMKYEGHRSHVSFIPDHLKGTLKRFNASTRNYDSGLFELPLISTIGSSNYIK